MSEGSEAGLDRETVVRVLEELYLSGYINETELDDVDPGYEYAIQQLCSDLQARDPEILTKDEETEAANRAQDRFDDLVEQEKVPPLVTDGGVEEGSVEYWRREAEKSDSHEWCEDCESSYFSHFETCPHCERKLVTDGGVDQDDGVTDRWEAKAEKNVEEWGEQSIETLLLAAQEELGELTQATLEYRAENGNYEPILDEIDDLGALLLQLHEAAGDHRFRECDDSDDDYRPSIWTDGGERP